MCRYNEIQYILCHDETIKDHYFFEHGVTAYDFDEYTCMDYSLSGFGTIADAIIKDGEYLFRGDLTC